MRRVLIWITLALAAPSLAAAPALAQIRSVDPDSAIDADLDRPQPVQTQTPPPADQPVDEPVDPGSDYGPPPADGTCCTISPPARQRHICLPAASRPMKWRATASRMNVGSCSDWRK